jgi:hypothetical protein
VSLDGLAGEHLTAVEFVEDFLQLRFGDALMVLFVWPDVADADGISVGFGQPNYRDALCSAIGESVTEADLNEGRSLTIEFENGTVFALSLRAEDLDTPEVGSFRSADGDAVEF